MKRRIFLLASVILLGGGAAWLSLHWYNEREVELPVFSDRDYAQANARMNPNLPSQPTIVRSEPLSPSHRVRLAIGWLGLPGESQNQELGDVLTAELTKAKGLELVDRQSLGKVLGELALNLSGPVRAKDAVRVGKLVGAEWFLLGSSGKAGSTNRFGATERLVTFEEAARLEADPSLRPRIRAGAAGDCPAKASLRLRPFGEGNWRDLSKDLALPDAPNCLALDGSDLWLGGPGYVAVFDLQCNKLRTTCTIPARLVDRIQIAGGYVWAQFDKHLHKAPLSSAR